MFDVIAYFTQAVDYADVDVRLNGTETQRRDLYDPKVSLGDPVVFKGLELNSDSKLEFEIRIRGANKLAKPSYMVGIDSIELIPK